jgi:sec-independent protein translocase protein TatC
MSEENSPGLQETFISHLVELRNRLVRASAVVLVVFIMLFAICPAQRRSMIFLPSP